jgi:hypothetical protein
MTRTDVDAAGLAGFVVASGDGPGGQYDIHQERRGALLHTWWSESALDCRVMKHGSTFHARPVYREVSRSLSSPDVFAVK